MELCIDLKHPALSKTLLCEAVPKVQTVWDYSWHMDVVPVEGQMEMDPLGSSTMVLCGDVAHVT